MLSMTHIVKQIHILLLTNQIVFHRTTFNGDAQL